MHVSACSGGPSVDRLRVIIHLSTKVADQIATLRLRHTIQNTAGRFGPPGPEPVELRASPVSDLTLRFPTLPTPHDERLSMPSNSVSSGAARYVDDPKREAQPFVPECASSLLDVGCWRGAFGAALKALRESLLVWGVEMNSEAASAARQRLDHVVHGSFPEAMPLDRRFDCITFLDVLEHFADPWSVLKVTKQLLNQDGVIIALVPNVQHYSVIKSLFFGEWTYRDTGILDRDHLRFFTKRTLVELFQSTGYEVDTVTPVNISTRRSLKPALRLLGRSLDGFRARHYVVVARRPVLPA